MSSPDVARELAEAIRGSMRESQFSVTTKDTDRLSSEISDLKTGLNSRLTQVLLVLGLVVTLLLATYGANALLMWRLIDRLTSAP